MASDHPSFIRRARITGALIALVLCGGLLGSCASDSAPDNLAFADDHVDKPRGNGPARDDAGANRGNPNGSNGTIKIDGIDVDGKFDSHPNNEPHISACTFEVDLYGFDSAKNEDTATLRFTNWPPTGKKTTALATAVPGEDDPAPELAIVNNDDGSVTVVLQDDGAGGGIDVDRQVLVTLVTEGDAHPNHGNHVRLDAGVASDGKDYKKSKTFWVEGPCLAPKPTATPIPPTATPVPPTATPVPILAGD